VDKSIHNKHHAVYNDGVVIRANEVKQDHTRY